MDLLYFLKVLFRKKWIIIGLSFLAVVVAFLILINKKPLFRSVAQYSTGFTAEKVRLVDGSSAIDLYTAEVKFDNTIETIKSPQVINMISYWLLLHDLSDARKAFKRLTIKDTESAVYREMNKDTARRILTEKLARNEMLRSDDKTEKLLIEYLKLYDYDYESLLEYLSINRVLTTDYLDISFYSENPELSAIVVNAVGKEFLNYYKNLNSKRTEENAINMKGIVESQQSRVDSIGQQLLTEKISQGTIDPLSRTTSAMETIKDLESKLAEEESKYNEHSNRVSYLTAELESLQSGASGASNDEVLRLTNKKNDLVAELARRGGNDADLQQQISDLRTQIVIKSNNGVNKNKVKDDITDVKKQLNEQIALMNASSSTIGSYKSKIREYQGMTNINPGSGIKMDVLKEKLDQENKQLASAKEKYAQVESLSKDDPTTNFIQTRVGQPAVEAESKKTLVKMILAGVSVFFLLCIFFLFLEIFDSSVKTPAIFNKQSKVKITNILNSVKLKSSSISDIVMEDYEGKQFLTQNVFKNNVRKLRYELMNSGKHIFLITSTQKKAGKSSVIEALATSLLLSKKKVLIIDLNFSHNSLTQKYNTDVYIQDIAGKLNYNLPASVQKIWGNTLYQGLSIIGCKEGNITPSEALYNIDMVAFLKLLRTEYDFILIEGASLNNYADSKELAQYAEGVFVVFSAATAISQPDNEALRFVSELKEKNNGVILNKVLTENINS